ncbi:MAG: hypothetical protein KAZ94_05540 [Burkholderiales bacterium]|jgi:hypothetical protein|nr:hypothetical protein [Burkholderiales bacterium]MBP9769382.1 hypothetical protein [Burkholderiales bacterium]
MPKLFIFFVLGTIFSLIFHFVIGGDSALNYQNMVIKFNLYDVLLAALLLSNLFALILLLRRKK